MPQSIRVRYHPAKGWIAEKVQILDSFTASTRQAAIDGLTKDKEEKVRLEFKASGFIPAIRKARELFGGNLMESKFYVENRRNKWN